MIKKTCKQALLYSLLMCVICGVTAFSVSGESISNAEIKYQLRIGDNDTTDVRFILVADEHEVINVDTALLYATINDYGDTASVTIKRAYRSIKASGKTITADEGKVFLIGRFIGIPDDLIDGMTAHFSLGEKTHERTLIVGNTNISLSEKEIVTKLKKVSESKSGLSISSVGTTTLEYRKRIYIFNIADYERIHIINNIDSSIAFYNTETPMVENIISSESVIGVTTLKADTKTEFNFPKNALSFGITVTSSDPDISVIGVNKNTYLESISDLSLMTENLINPEFVQDGDRQGYKRTGNIEVEPNTTYVVSRHALLLSSINPHASYKCQFLDENLNIISSIETNPFTTPANCKYIYLTSMLPYYFDNYKLEKGSDFTGYVPYGLKQDYPEYYKSPFKDKKFCAVGDSITAGQTSYVRGIVLKTGMKMLFDVNNPTAIPGSTVTKYGNGDTTREDYMCSTARVNAIPQDSEVILIMGGTNDYNATIGTLDGDHVETTFYGALQLMLDRIYARCPNADIYLCEMPYKYGETDSDEVNTVTGMAKKVHFEKRQQAIRDISEKYGCSLLSTSNEGVDISNYTDYRLDGVHPNAAGRERLATIFSEQMLAYHNQ